ncbi:MAG: hypothetical protein HY286_16805 [Planctomycetes bacterium]|nr:hypothetical protein [Planctomycetota bacterium]
MAIFATSAPVDITINGADSSFSTRRQSVSPNGIEQKLTVGLKSSGSSPPSAVPATVHLLGVGKVGRALLQQFDASGARLVAATDSTATVYDRGGLSPRAILQFKEKGRSLINYPGGAALPTELALQFVNSDIVIDALPTDSANPGAALDRARAALATGSSLALASKDALFAGASELTSAPMLARVGIRAALGGAGAAIARDLIYLQNNTAEIAVVANATTTTILECLSAGESYDSALATAKARGLFESDPESDLDGTDAAIKLGIITQLIFKQAAPAGSIAREHIQSAATAPGARLVGRARRDGNKSVRYESLDRRSPLCAPPDRVLYQFTFDNGASRLYTGFAVGAAATAAALLDDVRELIITKGGAR